jgi:apolipoprotein N-acyltransferase
VSARSDARVAVAGAAAAVATPPAAARRGAWRRRGLAALWGALAAGALPPMHAVPLLLVAFPALLLLVSRTADVRRAFFVGWWFGFGHFVAGLYWLAWPLTLDLAAFGWMIPFAVFGISGLLAIVPAAAVAALQASGTSGIARVLALALAWTAGEWLRGHLLTGFPWNLAATAWTAVEPMMQSASLVGAYGLGFLTVVVAATPVLLFEPGLSRLHRAVGMVAAAALLVGLWIWGADRIAGADARPVEGVRLRLVQGNVEQSLKWDAGRREQTFAHYVALTRRPGFESVTHVIWPETAIDYRFVTDYDAARVAGERQSRVASAVPPRGALITGAIRDERREWFNSVHVVGPDGAALSTYDKHHLVPFGEYVPLRWLLRRIGIERIAHGSGDYSAGPGPETLEVPGAPPTSPLVCYEAIFPGRVAAPERPGWLVNVTNDAWFGLTSGPYQHFASARLRAVEEGVPLVRAANTGITAVVDAYGRIAARMPIQSTGVLDAELPRAQVQPTLYARLGDRALLVLLLIGLALALAADLRQMAQRNMKTRQPHEKS